MQACNREKGDTLKQKFEKHLRTSTAPTNIQIILPHEHILQRRTKSLINTLSRV